MHNIIPIIVLNAYKFIGETQHKHHNAMPGNGIHFMAICAHDDCDNSVLTDNNKLDTNI